MDYRPDYETKTLITSVMQSTAAISEPLRLEDTRKIRPGSADVARRFWRQFKTPQFEDNLDYMSSAVNATAARTESNGGHLANLPRNVGSEEEQRISFHPLQEWEGYVTAVRGDTFIARLTDLTRNAKIAEEEGDFPITDIAEEDRELLAVGSVFRWAVGYLATGGTKYRVSHIVFRRLRWTREDLTKADEEGRELAAQIKWQ
jgi:hypothetical protein